MNLGLFAIFAFFLLLVAGAVFLASGALDRDGEVAPELVKERALWETNKPASYTLRVERGCFCDMRPIVSTIKDGKVILAVFEERGGTVPMTTQQLSWELVTVERLYDEAEKDYRVRFEQIELTYDKALHYPTKITYDGRRNTTDDEGIIRARVSVP